MDKMFGPAYTGDPGVPHADKDMFWGVFSGAALFGVWTMINPYHWEQAQQAINWHDFAMVCENHRYKQACRKKQPYEFKWNKMAKRSRDAYYQNWQDFFP
eukprot:TRINITY_DN10560_c0_g1_i1.p1 TRINITY_DN10560_c0_g1~~TRINITY_DN10560_c0_g1_i1.p1  ORF type:complete len:100 (+),score=23.76 TRINITY_DN10560_c0_g1_i1:63-362(+)